MPELPEMQALSERLEAIYGGATLKRFDLLQFSSLKTVEPSPSDLYGTKVTALGRRGKYVFFAMGDKRLMFHLSQGGRVDIEDPPKATKPKGSIVRLHFDGRPSMLIKEFGTERKAALWVLASEDPGPLERLGPEPDSEAFAAFIRTGQDKRRLHTMLRDQRTVAGIGRGFADDILHDAKLAPFDPLSSLNDEQREQLLQSSRRALDAALARERQREGGLPTKMQGRFTVHGKYGEACSRCKNTLRRVSYEAYEVTYCPTCQTRGKVLADRRTSRFLK
ncbi:MAG: DNA-formamidopyrimidine glycosylase family protein [Actinomycetota bacterium]